MTELQDPAVQGARAPRGRARARRAATPAPPEPPRVESGLGGLARTSLVLLVLACRLLAIHSCPLYDDAFITYRYARNLAAGEGLVYDPGAAWEPVLGTTTPGYAVLLAAPIALGADPVRASLALNLLADVAAALLLLALLAPRERDTRAIGGAAGEPSASARSPGGGAVAAVVAVAVYAGLPQLARISVGGMEAPLFSALALGAALAASRGRPVTAGTCAALACTVRPEGVLLVGVLALARLLDLGRARWRATGEREPDTGARRASGATAPCAGRAAYAHGAVARSPLAALVRTLVPVAVVGALAMGALTLVYGTPVPHSVTAKGTTHAAHTLALSLQRMGLVLRQAFAPSLWLLPLVPLVLVGYARAFRARRGAHLFVAFGLAIVASYLAARPHTWGWYYQVPLVAWAIGLGLGAQAALERLAPALATRLAGGALRRALPATCLGLALAAFGVTRARPDRVTERVYRPLAQHLAALPLAAEHVLGSDIGALGYFAPEAVVLDSEGLVWPEAVPVVAELGSHAGQVELVRRWKPALVLLVATRGRVAGLTGDPELATLYEPVARLNAWGDRELRPALETLPTAWRQDYLLFRRTAP